MPTASLSRPAASPLPLPPEWWPSAVRPRPDHQLVGRHEKKVRGLVLEEVAPKMQGLSAEELAVEVKTALDNILQREDVEVTPIERRRFVQEMMSDTLGYGPLDPLLADATITEVMCNAYDDIWVERGPHRAHQPLVHR